MDLRQLIPAPRILAAFILGAVLGFALCSLGSWREVGPVGAVFLLVAVVGVCFGVLGLSDGMTAGDLRKIVASSLKTDDPAAAGPSMPETYRPATASAGTGGNTRGHREGTDLTGQPPLEREAPSGVGLEARAAAGHSGAIRSEHQETPSRDTASPAAARRGSDPLRPVAEDLSSGGRSAPRESERPTALPSPRPSFEGKGPAQERPLPPPFRPEDLIQIWEVYEAEGDGHFNRDGLARRLDAAGLPVRAVTGEEVGASDAVLGVAAADGGRIYLLPDFNRPATAVSPWFEDQGSGVRTACIKRLIQVAEVERRDGQLVVLRKGVVA